MKRLIVNADDFGLSPEVNAGILRAHRDGILRSASLM
ncbi:MAG: ChbG/HpnK family deacetylase, partial [Candidatus Binatus sp.]